MVLLAPSLAQDALPSRLTPRATERLSLEGMKTTLWVFDVAPAGRTERE